MFANARYRFDLAQEINFASVSMPQLPQALLSERTYGDRAEVNSPLAPLRIHTPAANRPHASAPLTVICVSMAAIGRANLPLLLPILAPKPGPPAIRPHQ